MPSRRQPRRLVGRRGLLEPGWTWVEVVLPAAKRPSSWPVFALVLLALASLVGFLFLLDRDGGHPATAAPPPHPATQFRLFQWSDSFAAWQFGNLNPQNSAYHEGEGVPFMLRIDNASPGDTYTFDIRYDCSHLGINGYDFLSRYDRNRGVAPALAEEAPGNASFDAFLRIPNDPIAFDDAESDRNFKLWGGSFAGVASGPSPGLCQPDHGQKAEKLYTLSVTATSPTVFLLWSGHLASDLDWGEGKGASSINGSPYHMKLDVPGPGVGERDRSIQIAPAPVAATATPAATPTPPPSPTPTAPAAPSPSPTPTLTRTPQPPTLTPVSTAGPGATATPTAVGGGPTATPLLLAIAAAPTPAPAALGLPPGGAGYLDPTRPALWLIVLVTIALFASPPAAYFAWQRWRAARPHE